MTDGRLHRLLEASLLLKAAHAVLECLGGIALAVVPTSAIVGAIAALTQDELREDPQDFIATHLANFAAGFSISTEHFFALYLLSHGVIKLLLVWQLLRGRHWAYPVALGVLGALVVYQIYRFSFTHSIGLILLTAFDILVLVMIWVEYRGFQHIRR